MSSDTINISCPAKINLALSVGAARAEDGMHPICSWMVAVGACDQVVLSRSSDGHSSFDIGWDSHSPLQQTVDWSLSSDLAFRAHALMEEHVGYALPINAKVSKALPAGAGLGGGSSDAAGMLKGLNDLFALKIDEQALIQLGLRLGSDVGFMVWTMLGRGPAIVSGTGNRIEQAPGGEKMINMVLIFPPVQCATREVYRVFDRITDRPCIDEERVRSLAGVWPVAGDALFNDLAEAAFVVQPKLREVREQVRDVTGMNVYLSGSGSAMFVVVQESGAKYHEVAEHITRRTGFAAIGACSMQVVA